MRPKKRKAPPGMTRQELDIIARYGEAFAELLTGERPPRTPAQRHFIDACRGLVKPTTQYEVAFLKVLQRQEFERVEERHRQELRDRKEAARKKAEAKALEMQRAREKAKPPREEQPAPDTSETAPDKPKRRRRRREPSGPSGIPEYEEGYPRPGWFTDEDWKKGRSS